MSFESDNLALRKLTTIAVLVSAKNIELTSLQHAIAQTSEMQSILASLGYPAPAKLPGPTSAQITTLRLSRFSLPRAFDSGSSGTRLQFRDASRMRQQNRIDGPSLSDSARLSLSHESEQPQSQRANFQRSPQRRLVHISKIIAHENTKQ